MATGVPRRRRALALAGLPLAALAGVLAWPGDGAAPPVAPATEAAIAGGLWVDGADPSCRDTQDRTGTAPFCTPARAAAVAQAGDTVHIAAGRYGGTVRPARGGTPDAPIVFVADEPGVVLDADGANNAVMLLRASDVAFEGMEITGGANQGVWVEASDRVRLSGVTVRANRGAGVQLKSGTGTQILSSTVADNARAGLLELAGARNTRVADSAVTGNGRDGAPYNGDGLQLGGTGGVVRGNTITGNGDPGPYEHGVYTGSASKGWLIEKNTISGSGGANVKAMGTGTIAGNRLVDGRYGIVLATNPAPVDVFTNVITGRAQHLVFLTGGARGRLYHDTIRQTGRSTTSGAASAIFASGARISSLSHAPSASAVWNRTCESGSAARRISCSATGGCDAHRSARRTALSRTPGLGSTRSRRTRSISSWWCPSRVQAAWRRPNGLPDEANARSAGQASRSCRSISSRCAVVRHHPFGFSSSATSSAADAPLIRGRLAGGAESCTMR